MNRSIEQALASLLPTHNGSPPSALVELATSLLAQSRSRASTLKAEEEIARSYACANLACERLKQPLNLPPIAPRPPCPPRVYKKLYAHLSATLRPESARKSTTRPTSSPQITPSKRPKPSPRNRRPPPSSKCTPFTPSTLHTHASIPASTMPLIRHLCAHLPSPSVSLAPHIYTGVASILTLPPPLSSPSLPQPAKRDKLPALIIAVFFFLYTRARGRATGGGEFEALRESAVGVLLQKAREEEWGARDVDGWVREISERGWLAGSWFEEVREGWFEEMSGGEEGEEEEEEEEEEVVVVGGEVLEGRTGETLLAGLGTMMQERVDWLSEGKRAEYGMWKAEIMESVVRMETERGLVG